MEDEIDCIDPPELARLEKLVDPAHSFRKSVGEVDGEQAVGGAGCVDHAAHLGFAAPERLLAEDRDPALQSPDRLLGM